MKPFKEGSDFEAAAKVLLHNADVTEASYAIDLGSNYRATKKAIDTLDKNFEINGPFFKSLENARIKSLRQRFRSMQDGLTDILIEWDRIEPTIRRLVVNYSL